MNTTTLHDVQARITRYWDHRAHSYDHNQRQQRTPGDLRAAWLATWASAVPSAPAEVLDVGTGTGQVALQLAELGHQVTGIDLSTGMLELARHKAGGVAPPPSFQLGDACAPGLPDGSFDAVVTRYVLWTLHAPEAALARWFELLRPGGRLAVVDSTWFPAGIDQPGSPGDAPNRFRSCYDPEVVASLPLAEARTIADTVTAVGSAGFDQVQISPLWRILEVEQRLTDELEHTPRLQYLITGRRPA